MTIFAQLVAAREYVDAWSGWWVAEGESSDPGPERPAWATSYHERQAKRAGQIVAALARAVP